MTTMEILIAIGIAILCGGAGVGGTFGVLAHKSKTKKTAKKSEELSNKELIEKFQAYTLKQISALRSELNLPVLTREQYEDIAKEHELYSKLVYAHDDKNSK